MDYKIRQDARVSVIERTNLRYLSELPQKVDLVTLDLSFISILTVSYGKKLSLFGCVFIIGLHDISSFFLQHVRLCYLSLSNALSVDL